MCENSSAPGYITEKHFNEYSFINIKEFHSRDELIKKVKELIMDDGKYNAMVSCPKLKELEKDYFSELVAFIGKHTS